MRLFAAAVPDLGRLPAQLPEGALVVVAPSGEAWEEQLGRAGELARSRALWVVVAGPRREGEG
ncbi:MAG: hypothetical protein IRZ26_09060, partial [Clostridia bacterium]|nr:hypothetical protein [Clostridia bacterium]